MFFQDSTLNQTFVVVQSFSCVRLCVIPWTAAGQASLFFTISWSLLRFMSIESVIPSNYLILCYPLLLLETDPSVFPNTSIFSNESALCIKWPKYQSFSISPSNEYSGLIYFRIDWFDLLAVHILSEISTMNCPSWMALNSMAHSFLELCKPFHQDKAVIHEEDCGIQCQ